MYNHRPTNDFGTQRAAVLSGEFLPQLDFDEIEISEENISKRSI